MTLAPPFAGIAGWLMLGERMAWQSWLAILVTLSGIALSILAKKDGSGIIPAPCLPTVGLPYAIINKQRVSLKEIIGTLITVTGVALFFLL